MNNYRAIIKYKKIISVISLFILCTGCSSNKDAPKTPKLGTLKLTKDLTIKATTKKALIGGFDGLAAGARGNIFVADKKLHKIHIFSSDGNYVGSLGRKGKGPGEFARLNPHIHIQADTLYAMENVARRIELFNIHSRKFIRSIKIPKIKPGKSIKLSKIGVKFTPTGHPRNLFPLRTGNILIPFGKTYFRAPKSGGKPHYITISMISSSGKILRKNILQFPEPYPNEQGLVYITSGSVNVFTNLFFYPEFIITVGPKGNLYAGLSDSLFIQTYSRHGIKTNVLKATYKPAQFTNSDMDSLVEKRGGNVSFKKAIKKIGLPNHWPVFQDFIIDDEGRCWVELLDPGKSRQTWWVFNKNDQPKWKFKLPSSVKLYEVKKGEAYGISQSRNSFSSVVRYRVSRM
jgi:hypothetical protein